MSEEKNKLAIPVKLGTTNAPSWGLKGKLQTAAASGATLDNVSAAKERIIIVADDSGSMDGLPMEQQKKAIAAFLGVCNPSDTAVGVTPMNRERINLTMIHPIILSKTAAWPINGGGGTPTFGTLAKALEQNPSRVVLISDGQPTDGGAKRAGYREWDTPQETPVETTINPILQKYKDKNVKIDTVFIGEEYDTSSQKEMQDIASLTGGMYIFFKEGESFAKQFKYLAPAYYAMLTAGQIKL